MDVHPRGRFWSADDMVEQETTDDVKKGPWTEEEDTLLMNYVGFHGEGRWNSVAHFGGLKRTGKSCRLRWLNYLRPDLRRGNMSLQEQLLILELHSRYGNRWSKIARDLPGRTDNEVKNYWRTRVQKQAKQLKCDVNSKQFRDTLQYVWMPRLREQIQSSLSKSSGQPQSSVGTYPDTIITTNDVPMLYDQDVFKPSIFVPEMSGCTSNDSSMTHLSHGVPDPWESQWSESFSDNRSGVFNESFTGFDGPWLGEGGEENLMMMDNWWIEEKISLLKQHLFDDDDF